MKRAAAVESASALIDEKIKELGDSRRKMLVIVMLRLGQLVMPRFGPLGSSSIYSTFARNW
jgi:hypothetical protein